MNERALPSLLEKLPLARADLLFEETLRQLSKDLDIEPGAMAHIKKNHLAELEQLVALHLHTRTEGKKSTLQSLLYRADISEKDYRNVLNQAEGRETERLLAPLFIFRAFTKCYTRMLAAEGKL